MSKNFSVIIPDERIKNASETILRQSQLVMLRILRVVDYICREHDIVYWLDSGTLLGAVRHSGFIPWDDDIDIVMPRQDYNKFIKIANKELPEDLFLQTNETDIGYDMPWIKVRDNNSKIYEYKPGNYNNGMFIDIFPVDFYENEDTSKVEVLKKRYKLFHRVLTSTKEPMESVKSTKIFIKNSAKIFLKTVLLPYTIMKRERINYRLNKLKNKYIQVTAKEQGTYVGYGVDVIFWKTTVVSKNNIFPLKEISFEGYNFFVPNNYDLYLRKMFGDYMKLPPVEQRIPHNLGLEPIAKKNLEVFYDNNVSIY